MNDELRRQCVSDGLDPVELEVLIHLALDEDLRFGCDVTTAATVPRGYSSKARVVSREFGVVCGLTVATAVLDAADFALGGVTSVAHDGDRVAPGESVMNVEGPLEQLLLAERTLLNFLSRMSGIATTTNAWVTAVAGTGCHIRDTRKTTPGHRQLEKYAVRCGGGVNHRMGLGDAALVKDNHVAAAGGVSRAVAAIRRSHPDITLEVECDTVEQVREAVDSGCSLVLLDNMSVASIEEALEVTAKNRNVRVEVSGGITFQSARSIAELGVDYIAVGSLTHSIRAHDFGVDI